MSEHTTAAENGHDSSELEPRTRRALTEKLTVLTPDGFPVTDADRTVVSVTSQSGETYTVDVRDERCECPDARHRDPDGGCKHVRRARVALGRTAVPAAVVTALDVDPSLGEHVCTSPQLAATDGGVVDAGDDAEILTDDTADGRPDECRCDALGGGLCCWSCWQEGYDETPETDA